jgi:hypothetical protein
MSGQESDQIDQHASARHAGFSTEDPEFESIRAERAELVDQFLTAMDQAGNPGLERKLGSTVRDLTGQTADEYWSASLVSDDGSEREVVVFSDGRHGWSDELAYSDRPRSRDDEIEPAELRAALTGILEQHGLSWP